MLMADNMKLMSKMEALEAENASLKGERSKLKGQIARESYQLREEKKLHEHVQSSLLEGREVAVQLVAAEARQLSETIMTTSHAMEEARKSLKELQEHVASAHTVRGVISTSTIRVGGRSRRMSTTWRSSSLPTLATTRRRATQPRRRVMSRQSTRVSQRILRKCSGSF
jgi:chromosome segregation ATPase